MAKRRRREPPKVPRSSASPTMAPAAATATAGAPRPTPVRRGPREITPAEMHAYVKRDLARIGLIGGSILIGMFLLKFIGF